MPARWLVRPPRNIMIAEEVTWTLGMAEMPFIPLAPAIIAAVHDATGEWIDEIPLTPWRVLEAMKKP